MKEIWKDVPNYEGMYQASNLGSIKSLTRKIKRKDGNYQTHNGKTISPSLNGYGYLTLSLYKNNILKRYKVHQLIAMAFLNHIPDGCKLVVDHIDNDKLNNNINNLQIITHRENDSKDQFRHKRSSKYIGVRESGNRWRSQIRINDLLIHLGVFENEYDAHISYQNKLKEII